MNQMQSTGKALEALIAEVTKIEDSLDEYDIESGGERSQLARALRDCLIEKSNYQPAGISEKTLKLVFFANRTHDLQYYAGKEDRMVLARKMLCMPEGTKTEALLAEIEKIEKYLACREVLDAAIRVREGGNLSAYTTILSKVNKHGINLAELGLSNQQLLEKHTATCKRTAESSLIGLRAGPEKSTDDCYLESYLNWGPHKFTFEDIGTTKEEYDELYEKFKKKLLLLKFADAYQNSRVQRSEVDAIEKLIKNFNIELPYEGITEESIHEMKKRVLKNNALYFKQELIKAITTEDFEKYCKLLRETLAESEGSLTFAEIYFSEAELKACGVRIAEAEVLELQGNFELYQRGGMKDDDIEQIEITDTIARIREKYRI